MTLMDNTPSQCQEQFSCPPSCVKSRRRDELVVYDCIVVVLLLVAGYAIEGINAAECFCDKNAATKNALNNVRVSAGIVSWDVSSSTCTWSGVGCSATVLRTLTLCSYGVSCAGGTLPATLSTWQAIGSALTSLVISGGGLITGSFPPVASTSLTVLTSLSFFSYSPTGNVQLPNSTVSFSLTLSSSSTITIAPTTSSRFTYLAVVASKVPDVSGILSLASVSIDSGTLNATSWTSMTGLTQISISATVGVLPSWTGANFPSLKTIALLSHSGITSLPASWSTLGSLTSLSISFCSGITSPLPSNWSSLTNLRTLSIFSTPFAGPLPSSWNGLLSITTINIASANFAGATLPATWTSIPNLTSLKVADSNLCSPLPQWPNATLLTYLGLQGNSITSPLQTVINGWSTLKTLDLSNNPINGTLPPWPEMTSLVTFYGFSSRIVGPLPEWGSVSSPMMSVQVISISNNVIGSTIPASWARMPQLINLNALSAGLTGQIPFNWTSSVLISLALSSNSLSGDISTLTFASTYFSYFDVSSNRIGSNCTLIVPSSLRYLELSNNLCEGTHPNWASATNLTFVSLRNNSFSGTLARIPSTVLETLRIGGNLFTGTLPSLRTSSVLSEISASNNWFTGTLPPFNTAARPSTLNFFANNLSGTFSNSATVLSAMRYLDLSGNGFSGAAPRLSLASSLVRLNLSFNYFAGSLTLSPSLTSLTLLDVSCNSFTGSVPSWSTSIGLAYVNLTCGNFFTGTMPLLSQKADNTITILDLSDQGLTGQNLSAILPTQPLSSVTTFLLGGNALNGSLPAFWMWQKLEQFNVTGNNLTGTLPFTTIALPPNIWSIDISNNNALTGAILDPSSITKKVQHLLLGGDNHYFSGALPALSTKYPSLTRFSLSGSFPLVMPYSWLNGSVAWVNLTALSLRKCGFFGTFPEAFASGNITSLDLSWNRLSGTLPSDLAAYQPKLVSINLSENGFTGSLPTSWLNFSNLTVLDVHSCLLNGSIPPFLPVSLQVVLLNNNRFSGTLPSSWETMTNLQLISMNCNSLRGSLPESWGNLTRLRTLNLSNNNLSNKLPSSWESMTSLQILSLNSNSLSGELPSSWANLTSLQTFELQLNNLNGSLPESWGNMIMLVTVNLNNNSLSSTLPLTWENMTTLQVLCLNANSFSGSLPESWSTMTSFETLELKNNNFSGKLPSSWGNMTKLQALYLANNNLSNTLPQSWSSMTELLTLDLSSNSLTGAPPPSWGNLTLLENLDLSNNDLSDTLPSSWETMTSLQLLSLNSNSLSGELPSSWGSMTRLQTLNLQDNSLSSSLPGPWGNMIVLVSLYLNNNNLSGELPSSWGSMTRLQILNLSFNSLNSTLPSAWWSMASLQVLILNFNSLSGSLPAVWSYISRLTALELSENTFSGILPSSWGNMTNLQTLNLQVNSLSSSLPTPWGNMIVLVSLYLNNNNLSGELPSSWGSMTRLQILNLSFNSLSNTLPQSWQSMTELLTLDLSSNSLTGAPPVAWGNLTRLRTLSLSNNDLSGTLPPLWESMTSLQAMYLSNNNLSGELPSSWENLKSIQFLNLSCNSLGGTLPALWGSMTSLQMLFLNRNSLRDALPVNWSNMSNLVTLSLSHNKLSSLLPPSWGSNMTSLRTLCLDHNSITGTLPVSWVTGVHDKPRKLYLSNNHLSGSLPTLGNVDVMTNSLVVVLDVHNNSITGDLPASWGRSMSGLQFLDLSANELKGTIPSEWGWLGYNQQESIPYVNLSFNVLLTGFVPLSFVQTNKICLCVFNTLVRSEFRFRNNWSCTWMIVPLSLTMSIQSASMSSVTLSDTDETDSHPSSVTRQSASDTTTKSVTMSPSAPIAPLDLPKPTNAALKTATQVASGVGAVLLAFAAAPSSGFAVDRLVTLSGFGDCGDAARPTVQTVMTDEVPNFLDAPLQLSFGDEFGASRRGTVLGNLMVFILAGIVAFVVVVAHRCAVNRSRQTVSSDLDELLLLLQSAAALRLPGAMIVIVVLLLDSLVASSVLLVGYATTPNDVVLGIAGLAVVSGLLIAAFYVLDPRPLAFQAVAIPVPDINAAFTLHPKSLRMQVVDLWDRITTPRNLWEARKLYKANSLFVEHFGYLFEDCRGGRHWWILIEATTTIFVSTLSGVVPESEVACSTKAWIALAFISVVLVACVAARPMNTRVESTATIVLLGAQVVVVACAISGVGNVADIIGLSVSISSAAVALLPIAWWLASLSCGWSCGVKRAPHSDVPAGLLRRNAPPVTTFSERDATSAALQVIIELICDPRRSE